MGRTPRDVALEGYELESVWDAENEGREQGLGSARQRVVKAEGRRTSISCKDDESEVGVRCLYRSPGFLYCLGVQANLQLHEAVRLSLGNRLCPST